MKTATSALFGLLLTLLPAAHAGVAEDERVATATEVVRELTVIPENAIPPTLLADAYGIAVIPGVIKAGFVVGGRFGKGLIAVKSDTGWSAPAFIQIAGGSLGWQIGAQSTDLILVFKTRRGVENLAGGKVTLGADAGVAAGPVGRRAEAATDAQLKAEIYSYSRTRGLFAGISLEGAAITPDQEANRAFYQTDVSPWDIFEGRVPAVPPTAETFRQALTQATAAP
jgi:lipid-binding SYLF domain-containing protein